MDEPLWRNAALSILVLLAAGCEPVAAVTVDLHSDFVPGAEFDTVEVTIDGTAHTTPADPDVDYLAGVRLGSIDITPGPHSIRVALLWRSRSVISRTFELTIRDAAVISTWLVHSCLNADCAPLECDGGRCVEPSCEPGDPCASPACMRDSDCASGAACGAPRCDDGSCLFVPLVGACAASEYCDPMRGCVEVVAPLDAGGSDSGSPLGPYAPVAPATNSVWTVEGSPSRAVTIGATDADGDIASYEVTGAGPARGSVTFFGDTFVFTPSPGAGGSDAFTIRISDSGGRFAEQVVSVSVVPVPSTIDWRYFAAEGESVTLGGNGEVNGTNGPQEVVVAEVPGLLVFEASFNRGNDAVRLTGNAADWLVAGSAGNATLTDGATFVRIPAFMGTALVFDDGIRVLRSDGGSGSAIGSQAITEVYVPITASADGTSPGGIVTGVRGVLYVLDGGSVVVGGTMDLRGTAGVENVVVLGGDVRFDASFNQGGDTIVFPGAAATFDASYSASQAVITRAGLVTWIPIGMVGMSLGFADATHTLRYDGTNVLIGAQIITTTPAPLTSP